MNKSILLIDDNPINSSGYIYELKRHYNVDVVIHLTSAERLIKNRHYDVIVIDVLMPNQQLECQNELYTGFAFYFERLLPILNNYKPLIIFWSYCYENVFYNYFAMRKEQIPDYVYYVRKDYEDNDLLKRIDELIGG